MATDRSFMVGDWMVEPTLNRIRCEGEVRALRPQVMELLVYLAERPGQVVSPDELLSDLWDGRIVTEGSVYNGIRELRLALALDSDPALPIETIPKKGYRLVVPVAECEPVLGKTSGNRRLAIVASTAIALAVVATLLFLLPDRDASSPGIRSLAVLPLENQSPAPRTNDYIAAGITETLIATLGKIQGLKVISRTSSMRLNETDMTIPEIARVLGVDGVIEGSVMTDDRQILVTVQLIDGRTDTHVYADFFKRDYDDILDLQTEIANAIALQLSDHLTTAGGAPLIVAGLAQGPTTGNPDAYRTYLKGRYAFNRFGLENFRTALRFYEAAIDLDPSFALAYASLAEVCAQPSILRSGSRTLDDCERAAIRAVALDEQLAEAHVALGFVQSLEWKWRESEEHLERAIQLDANSVMARQWYSQVLRSTYRFDESLAEIRLAEELDPLNLFVKTMVGWPLFNQRRYDEALAQWADVIDMDSDYMLAHYNQGLAYIQLGRPDEVFAAAERVAGIAGPDAFVARMLGAAAHAISGETEKALGIISSVDRDARPIDAVWIATVYLMLGDEDQALTRLETALANRSPALVNVTEPAWDSVRTHQRFLAVTRAMGLPDAAGTPASLSDVN